MLARTPQQLVTCHRDNEADVISALNITLAVSLADLGTRHRPVNNASMRNATATARDAMVTWFVRRSAPPHPHAALTDASSD
jgi:hypothetical protein